MPTTHCVEVVSFARGSLITEGWDQVLVAVLNRLSAFDSKDFVDVNCTPCRA